MTKKIQDQRQPGIKSKPNYDIEHINLNHITKDLNKSKAIYEYENMDNDEKTWMDEKKLKRIATELIDWAKNQPDATQLQKFFDLRGMAQPNVRDWRIKWPWFEARCTHAKNIIASRLFDGGLVKSYSEGLVKLALPMNSEEWKEESNRVARLKEEQQAALATRPITIVMQDYKIEDTSVGDKEKVKK